MGCHIPLPSYSLQSPFPLFFPSLIPALVLYPKDIATTSHIITGVLKNFVTFDNRFLWVECPFCRQNNRIKALNETQSAVHTVGKCQLASSFTLFFTRHLKERALLPLGYSVCVLCYFQLEHSTAGY